MKVLLSAYACAPNSGTEPGHGWGTATHLAKRGMEVHVLTQLRNKTEIEKYVRSNPIPRLFFSYVDHPKKTLKSDGMRYLLWQWSAIKTARELHRIEKFDIAHHVTYGSIHVPTQLWRIGVPVVFGPVGGGQTTPVSMLEYFGADKRREQRRTSLTRVMSYSPFHRYWLSRMSAVIVCNRETMRLAHSLGREDAEMMFDTIIPDTFLAPGPRRFEDHPLPLKLLWVGRMVPRKALALSLDILANVRVPATLTIIGNGIDEATVRNMISKRRLTGQVFWQDRRLPWEEVRTAYLEHDVMLFNSLRETGGAQLVESMALGLPIVTLDMHGPRDLVPDQAGLKIEVLNPRQVVDDAAAAIDRFAQLSGEERSRMSRTGWEFARNLTCSKRAEQTEEIYRRVLSSSCTPVGQLL